MLAKIPRPWSGFPENKQEKLDTWGGPQKCLSAFVAVRLKQQPFLMPVAIFFDYIEMFYNSKRRHGSSDQMSPTEYENQYYQRLRSV